MAFGFGKSDVKSREALIPDMPVASPAAVTDAGCERELNEDRYAVVESRSGLAWLVCDGMGGATGGELAAQLALEAIRRDLELGPVRAPEEAIKSAILQANRIIVLRRQNPAFGQMGTTVVAALFSGSEMVIGHAGDSRAYLVRGSAVEQLSTDHTFVQELVEKGKIKPDEALNHPDAHILTRCIGSEPGLIVDTERFWVWELEQGQASDSLMLCSDGLYSHVTDVEIGQIIYENSPQDACARLVELAKSRGGYDNITVAVVPLSGTLHREPPAGYNASAQLHARYVEENDEDVVERKQNVLRDALLLSSISALAVLITFFVTILMISK